MTSTRSTPTEENRDTEDGCRDLTRRTRHRTDDEGMSWSLRQQSYLREQGRTHNPRISYSTFNQDLAERTGQEPFNLATNEGR